MKKVLLFPVLLASVAVSCKKDPAANDPLKLLTSKPWKPSVTDKNTATNPQGDISYYPWLNCNNDDVYSFGNNGILIYNSGALKCTGDAGSTQNYSVDLNTNMITIAGVRYHLAEISSTQLKYYADVPQASGFLHIVYTYEH